jgi:Na+/melibiose symporter-like transporter
LELIQSSVQSIFSQIESVDLLTAVLLVATVIPPFVAAFSRRATAFLGSLALSTIALIVFFRPSLATSTISIGALVGSMIVAACGLGARRRMAAVETKLANIGELLTNLHIMEEQKRFIEFKSRGDPQEEPGDQLSSAEKRPPS